MSENTSKENKRRKVFLLIPILALAVIIALVLIFVLPKGSDCVHANLEVIKGSPATCTADGLTDGTKCVDCGEIITNQTVITKNGHAVEIVKGSPATCTADGLSDSEKCSDCGVVLAEQSVLKAKGHTKVTVKGSPATCTADGLSDGEKCSDCDFVYVEQTTLKALGHSYNDGVCSRCGKKETEITYTLSSDGNSYSISRVKNCTDMEIVIPSVYNGKPVTAIADRAFYGCDTLVNVTIPDSVTSIGMYAFRGCTSLKSITIPEGVKTIDAYTFCGCTSLESVTIPDSVTSIGIYAFRDCTSLKSITIPEGVKTIDVYTFYGCTSLESVTIPDSVNNISVCAFSKCSSLESVTIPARVVNISRQAFAYCTKLTSISFLGTYAQWKNISLSDDWNEGVPSSCVITYESNLEYTLSSDGTYYIVSGIGSCTDKKIYIPDVYKGKPVKEIADNAFISCSLTSVIIPDSITSIGKHAFSNCYALKSVTIPDSVTSIGEAAFIHCYVLTSIDIPASVTSIGVWAFGGCYRITSVNVDPDNTVYYSKDNCIIEKASKTLIAGFNSSTIPNDGSVTKIGEKAFFSMDFTSITIPESITFIGEQAFAFCQSLESINFLGTKAQWDAISFGSNWNVMISHNYKITYKG